MSLPRTAGGWAIAFAVANVALMSALATSFDGLGMLLPMLLPGGIVYWALAFTTIGWAVVALRRGQWRSGSAALLLVAVTLLPSALVFYQCSQGNCF